MAKNLVPVIDDDESVGRSTRLLIESFGYRAVAFESADNFLSSGRLNDTSCLIVDALLPGMNGLELQSHLAAAGSCIPIVFITPYGNKQSRRQTTQAGTVAFLRKPFTDDKPHQTIRSALGQERDGMEAT